MKRNVVVVVVADVCVAAVSDRGYDSKKEPLSSTSVWSFHQNASFQKRPTEESAEKTSLTWKTSLVKTYF